MFFFSLFLVALLFVCRRLEHRNFILFLSQTTQFMLTLWCWICVSALNNLRVKQSPLPFNYYALMRMLVNLKKIQLCSRFRHEYILVNSSTFSALTCIANLLLYQLVFCSSSVSVIIHKPFKIYWSSIFSLFCFLCSLINILHLTIVSNFSLKLAH